MAPTETTISLAMETASLLLGSIVFKNLGDQSIARVDVSGCNGRAPSDQHMIEVKLSDGTVNTPAIQIVAKECYAPLGVDLHNGTVQPISAQLSLTQKNLELA